MFATKKKEAKEMLVIFYFSILFLFIGGTMNANLP